MKIAKENLFVALPLTALLMGVILPATIFAGPPTWTEVEPRTLCGSELPDPPDEPSDCENLEGSGSGPFCFQLPEEPPHSPWCCYEDSQSRCIQREYRIGCCRNGTTYQWWYFFQMRTPPSNFVSFCGGDQNQPGMCYPTWW